MVGAVENFRQIIHQMSIALSGAQPLSRHGRIPSLKIEVSPLEKKTSRSFGYGHQKIE
jgi:hypothetical protein